MIDKFVSDACTGIDILAPHAQAPEKTLILKYVVLC